jgi:hypothetical protein
VKAVHDAGDEAGLKEASSYGKIVNLVVERRMAGRPEIIQLQKQMETVLSLFRADPEHPENQADEIKELELRINTQLNQVIGGIASIKTNDLDIRPVLLHSTTLVLKDLETGVETPVAHQGHGLQRTLVMTLLQVLSEIESESDDDGGSDSVDVRPVILAVEKPELYMHPQMERKMRDLLYRLASRPNFQVICTTHSPVFLDMGRSHSAIVRVVKGADGRVSFFQVTSDLFTGDDAQSERDQLRLITSFHPTVNEVFFARRVVLLEEQSALGAFQRCAELTGLFERHPDIRRDATLIDCVGKQNIPLFQTVLNHFQIQYTVVHDQDAGNPAEQAPNSKIETLLSAGVMKNSRHMISPNDLEHMLGYEAKKHKPYEALMAVERLCQDDGLPVEFSCAMNWVYFGQETEPA